jgi:hypothetical protein
MTSDSLLIKFKSLSEDRARELFPKKEIDWGTLTALKIDLGRFMDDLRYELKQEADDGVLLNTMDDNMYRIGIDVTREFMEKYQSLYLSI